MNDLLKPALKRRMKWSFVGDGSGGQIDSKTSGVKIPSLVGIRVRFRIKSYGGNMHHAELLQNCY